MNSIVIVNKKRICSPITALKGWACLAVCVITGCGGTAVDSVLLNSRVQMIWSDGRPAGNQAVIIDAVMDEDSSVRLRANVDALGNLDMHNLVVRLGDQELKSIVVYGDVLGAVTPRVSLMSRPGELHTLILDPAPSLALQVSDAPHCGAIQEGWANIEVHSGSRGSSRSRTVRIQGSRIDCGLVAAGLEYALSLRLVGRYAGWSNRIAIASNAPREVSADVEWNTRAWCVHAALDAGAQVPAAGTLLAVEATIDEGSEEVTLPQSLVRVTDSGTVCVWGDDQLIGSGTIKFRFFLDEGPVWETPLIPMSALGAAPLDVIAR